MIPRPETVYKWPHLSKVPVHPVDKDAQIGLLIGINCSKALLPREIIAAGDEDPYAVRTSLGWSVTGSMCPNKTEEGSNVHFAFRTSAREVTPNEVRQMFELEFAENKLVTKISVQDTVFMKRMEEGITRREDGHLQLPLPLKDEGLYLPNNKTLALKRLQSLRRRMISDEKYQRDYKNFVANMLDKGYAEKVPLDAEEVEGRVWYIPHHGVYHPRKPEKIRVVFNCSAEYRGQSLNQNLLSGPDLLNSLTGILLRFRREQVAVTCDIEAMFHQVLVAPKYRDLLRFVWWPDGDYSKTPCSYRMRVHLFVATSSPGCANYALKYTATNGDTVDDRARKFIHKNVYVDDGLTPLSTPEEALQLIDSSRALCKSGGFNLVKFISNSKEVDENLPAEVRAKNIQNINFNRDSLPVEHALGVQWCVESDTLQFRVTLQDKPATRRGLLSTVSSVFDPLGLISPVVLTGKKLLQELCRDNAKWDDPLPDGIRHQWERWRTDLLCLATLQVPRCYKPAEFKDVSKAELHHFADASQEAYGQCSYLRLIDKADNVSCSLIFAKSRVAPVKTVTIPRLELTAALTAVRVSTFLNAELDYSDIVNVYWTDSTVVLGYISNEARRFHVYVANRIQQIRNASSIEDWHHINTHDNPADVASRGSSAKQLLENSTWWHGPAFLSSPQDIQYAPVHTTLPENDPEVRRATSHSTTTLQKENDLLERLEYFSSWTRTRTAVAVAIKYIENVRKRVYARKTGNAVPQQKTYAPPTVDELQRSERLILKAVQQRDFPEEVKLLCKQRRTNNDDTVRTDRNSQLHRLDPYMGNNELVRVGGRIRRANVPRRLAHPVILPRHGHVTQLIVRHYHERTLHGGREATLNEIRASGYWIVKARTAVTSYIWKCVKCREYRGKVSTQKMSDLPADRLESAPPFTYSGVDMFGPFYVREGRSERKRWGCLFTCLVCRVIHIEVTHSLSTDSFLNAYRRFIGRRGPVRQIRCDRGTNFVGAKNELHAALREMDDDKIQRTLSQDGCDWVLFKFNVPTASHMGGSWERMIRSARRALQTLLDQHSTQLDDELLETFMVEAESIVNGRPLTYIGDEKEPLTPSQLLTLKTKVILPLPGQFVKEDLFCRKRWRRIQYLANEFWRRWRREYLPTLQERVKWTNPADDLRVGDIVTMTAEDVPRCQWPKAVVTDTHPSEDNRVRKVTLKTGKSKFERPVHKLILLYRPYTGYPHQGDNFNCVRA